MKSPERILIMGHPGTGKSYQWLKTAKALKNTGIKFHVLDTDRAIPFTLENQFPSLMPEHGGNVYVYPAFDWPSYSVALKQVLKETKPNDWLVVDMADNAWDSVQRYFIGEVFDKDVGEYFLEMRKTAQRNKKSLNSIMDIVMEGWIDWPVVNRLYADWILPIIHSSNCNIYATTKVQRMGKREEPATKAVFGELGVRPSGQKHLGHQMHSCFLAAFDIANHIWTITTVKDRSGRSYFENTKLISFYQQYLVAKAHLEAPK